MRTIWLRGDNLQGPFPVPVLVEETGNGEECIIVTRFSEILNFQAVKLSERREQRSRTCILDFENVTF